MNILKRLRNEYAFLMNNKISSRFVRSVNGSPYASHVPVLISASKVFSPRKILEFGGGDFSTKIFFDRALFPDVTSVTTIETDVSWSEKLTKDFAGEDRFDLRFTNDPVDLLDGIAQEDFDLVLIDDSMQTTNRTKTIAAYSKLFKNRNPFIIHDYEANVYRAAADVGDAHVEYDFFRPFICLALPADAEKQKILEADKALMKQNRTLNVEDVARWNEILRG